MITTPARGPLSPSIINITSSEINNNSSIFTNNTGFSNTFITIKITTDTTNFSRITGPTILAGTAGFFWL